MKSEPQIAVIGGGSWATALVKIICNNSKTIGWWVRNKETADYINKYHHNPNYLSSVEFDIKKLSISSDLKKIISKSDVLIMTVPSAFLKESLSGISKEDLKNKKIFSAIKGIVPEHNLIIAEFFNQIYEVPIENVGVITGPSHAEEVAMEKMQFLDSYKREVLTFTTAIHYGYYNENEITKMISLMCASGLVVRQGERWFAVGAAMITETLKAVEESITHGKPKGVFETDCISSLYVGMESQKEQISGLMCVWFSDLITREKISFLFVKPEVVQEVVWGSKVDIYQGGMNPINSFGQWKESMSYHSEAWTKQARNAAQTILFLSLTGHKE